MPSIDAECRMRWLNKTNELQSLKIFLQIGVASVEPGPSKREANTLNTTLAGLVKLFLDYLE